MIDASSTDEFMVPQRAFKRRRFTMNDESMESETENTQNHSAIVPRGPFSSNFHHQGQSFKRCRTEVLIPSEQADLQKLVDSQSAEIQTLKSEKISLQNSFSALKGEHEKVVHENKTLKKAVLIQQERQNHAASELNAAREFKVVAEDRIKKLEQLVLSLRYHLQAQQNNTPSNDFMGFPPSPPDVY
jgi:hypothetical protein